MKPTPRSIGLALDGEPGPRNDIADVAPVAVGYWQHDGLTNDGRPFRSGMTAILPLGARARAGVCAAGLHSHNGNGELTGSHWIRDSGRLVGPIVLTHTHAVGAAHEGAVRWMLDRYPDLFRRSHFWCMPVIGECYDGFCNDTLGFDLRPEHAQAALDAAWAFAQASQAAARAGQPAPALAQGNVGGGTGMQSFGFKGGSGSSSRRVRCAGRTGHVGVFVQSNFGARHQLRIQGRRIGPQLTPASPFEARLPETGSIITIVATDLPLDSRQLEQVARRVPMGHARLGGSGGNYSGEIALALSTVPLGDALGAGEGQAAAEAIPVLDESGLDVVYEATVQATEEAVLNAMFAAESMPTHRPPGLLPALDIEQVRALLAL